MKILTDKLKKQDFHNNACDPLFFADTSNSRLSLVMAVNRLLYNVLTGGRLEKTNFCGFPSFVRSKLNAPYVQNHLAVQLLKIIFVVFPISVFIVLAVSYCLVISLN